MQPTAYRHLPSCLHTTHQPYRPHMQVVATARAKHYAHSARTRRRDILTAAHAGPKLSRAAAAYTRYVTRRAHTRRTRARTHARAGALHTTTTTRARTHPTTCPQRVRDTTPTTPPHTRISHLPRAFTSLAGALQRTRTTTTHHATYTYTPHPPPLTHHHLPFHTTFAVRLL